MDGVIKGCAALWFVVQAAAAAAADDANLAQQTLNPVASLISVPFQVNHDGDIGPADGKRRVVNVQPVAPFELNDEWNLISRTIVPVIDLDDVPAAGNDASGIGDVVQSFFFSPKQPTASGWIWGVGPVVSLPTADERALGSDKWSVGPTVVVLKQQHGWTYGILANHLISVGGDDDRADVEATFLQPFLSYTSGTLTSIGINTESTYDWDSETWAVPVNVTVTQLLRAGRQPLSLQVGARYWADGPAGGPDGWGYRAALTLLFPK
jgi:hypothetical protein